MRDELEKLAEQQAAILEAIAAIKDKLDAGEWRRKCLWVLADINRSAENLKKRLPGKEQTFKEIMEPLECYANLSFESTEDLHTLYTCVVLITESLAEAAKDGISTDHFRHHVNLAYKMLNELRTLEDGDPPGTFSAVEKLLRDDDSREAERKAVRKRIAEQSRASIKEMFARKREQENEFY